MLKKIEPRSAGRRSLGSGVVFAGAIDDAGITQSVLELQSARLVERYRLTASIARLTAELAFSAAKSEAR